MADKRGVPVYRCLDVRCTYKTMARNADLLLSSVRTKPYVHGQRRTRLLDVCICLLSATELFRSLLLVSAGTNYQPRHVESAPSLLVFCSRLKTHLFSRSFADFLYSACEVNCVIIGQGRLKTRDLTSRDWTTRHHIARVDIARLVSFCSRVEAQYK